MRCFALRVVEGRGLPCDGTAVEQIADQHYCGFHAEAIREAVRESDVQVYFAERDGLIKIGISRTPEQRAKTLRARLLATELGGREREDRLHCRFAHLSVRGEWFRPDDELLAYIAVLARRAA